MRFDVIVPCYNKKPDIVARCLDSISQAWTSYQGKDLDLHVMVVDDCSTEYSEELKQLTVSVMGSGIKWVYHRNGENLGCFLSRILGTVRSTSTGPNPWSGWTVHIDPDDMFLPNFFNVIIPFIKDNCEETTKCIPIEAEVYSVKGDYWDNDNVDYMRDFTSLRAVAEAGLNVWNSVCDKVWSTPWFYERIAKPINKLVREGSADKLKHINYMEDFLFSMLYMQYECELAYLPTKIERAYMDEDGSSCNETELGPEAKDKLKACMKQIRDAIEFLRQVEPIHRTGHVLSIDTLTAVRYAHQMDRLIKEYKLQ